MIAGYENDLNTFLIENLQTDKRVFYYREKYRTFSWSFEDIYDLSRKFSVLLSKLSIKKGDRIILRGVNHPCWIIASLGCIFSGVVFVPIDASSNEDYLLKILKKTKARVLVTDDPNSDGNKIRSTIPEITIIEFNDLEKKLSPFSTKNFKLERSSGEDLMEIVFTSGTTSDPKGVMITRGNLQSNLESIAPVMARWKNFFRLMADLKILSVVPLSHMYGQLIGIFIPLMIDSSIVFMESLNPRDIVEAIKEERIWMLGTLPRILEMIKNHISPDLGFDTLEFERKFKRFAGVKWPIRFFAFFNIHIKLGWRFVAIIVGGAAFDKRIDEFWRCIAYSIFQGYGLTETAPLITLADPAQTGAGHIGKVLEGQEVKLVNGEIYVKGPNVSPGYYKDREKTKAVFEDGWFKTGDLAEIGYEGNFVFKGRKDEVIVRSDGLNIYPGDIESVLNSDNDINDSAVFGIGDPTRFEIYAVLLLSHDFKGRVDDLIDKANRKLSVYQHIDKYIVWKYEDFPRTPTGKVRKKIIGHKIRELISEETVPAFSEDFKERKILNILKEFRNIDNKKIRGKARLGRDLGLDSLDLIQLAGTIEQKYDIDIDDSVISEQSTLDEVERVIKKPEKTTHKFPFPRFPYWPLVRVLRVIFQYVLYPFIRMIYYPEVGGVENLENIKGPVIFAANHSSIMDTFAVLFGLPSKIRNKVSTLMSIEYHFNHFFYHTGKWWKRLFEAIGFYLLISLFISICPLSRTHGFRQVMENIGQLMDKGWSILIYPEGMVTMDGKMKEFESGVGLISADMKVPVIPVKIDGLYNILRNGILPWGHMPRWPRVSITFGKQVGWRGKGYQEITREVYRKVKSL